MQQPPKCTSAKDQGRRSHPRLQGGKHVFRIVTASFQLPSFPQIISPPLEMWTAHTNNKLPTKRSGSVRRDERCLAEI